MLTMSGKCCWGRRQEGGQDGEAQDGGERVVEAAPSSNASSQWTRTPDASVRHIQSHSSRVFSRSAFRALMCP